MDTSGNEVIDFWDDIYWDKDTKENEDGVKVIQYPSFSDGLVAWW